jgi:hypothetical protein
MNIVCSNEILCVIAARPPDRLLKQRGALQKPACFPLFSPQRGKLRSLSARPDRFAEQFSDSWSAFATSPANSWPDNLLAPPMLPAPSLSAGRCR